MAVTSNLALWLSTLDRADVVRLGLPAPTERPRGRGKPPIPADVARVLVGHVDAAKRTAVESRIDYSYGDYPTDAWGLRAFMLDEYRRRLVRQGRSESDAADEAAKYSLTPEFEKHVNGRKVQLSRHRRSNSGSR